MVKVIFFVMVSLQWLEKAGISSESMFEQFVELPGASAPGSYHFVRILDGCMKADKSLQWLE